MSGYDFVSHTPSPPPGEEVCDFCSGTPVAWAYPCRPHRSGQMLALGSDSRPDMKVDFNSPDGWAACAVCHGMIQAGMRDKLAKRAADTLGAELVLRLGQKQTEQVMRGIQDNFWSNREGPPITPDEYRRRNPGA